MSPTLLESFFLNEPRFLATVFLTVTRNKIIIVIILFLRCFSFYCDNNCNLVLNAPLLINILSQYIYYLCPYTIWQTEFVVYQSKTSPAFINSGQNLVVVAYSTFFLMVEFDNYTNQLSSLGKVSLYFIFSHELVSFFS